MTVVRLKPEVQSYAWGHLRAIADLLGREPSGSPEAELWMGSHPQAPSPLAGVVRGCSDLAQLIAADPAALVGSDLSELPFLFKVLAADRPLSLQAHPNLQQARDGFEAEEAAGVVRSAPHRNYKDRNHKPELIYALTEFRTLSGFRPTAEGAEILRAFGLGEVSELAEPLRSLEAGALRPLFEALFTLSDDSLTVVVREVARRAGGDGLIGEAARVAPVAASLAEAYPGDSGVIAALLLNYVVLAPGEAMYLPAGNVHAYLGGLGLELMANSDNVLRCGLTPKHVDVPELCRVVRFEPLMPERIIGDAREVAPGVVRRVYRAPATEFELSMIEAEGGTFLLKGPAIALVLDGGFQAGNCRLERGSSVFVSASDPSTWKGGGRVAIASLPAPS